MHALNKPHKWIEQAKQKSTKVYMGYHLSDTLIPLFDYLHEGEEQRQLYMSHVSLENWVEPIPAYLYNSSEAHVSVHFI